ncbi:MAG TPA: SAM-dependent methyltransferase, partial [Cyclobacteriaceae bacterium]|nr:SAM-dependent methyltransferase [Cyclobacteriaceae bacterium]
MKKLPMLSIVGAGPGDPDLISLKAIKTLRKADVVLYDALVNPALLKHAPNAIKIYAGKRSGRHGKSQEEINRMIVN